MTITQPPKIKYLTNKDLLAEIHRSKNTFCSFTKPEYSDYDLILPNLEKLNIRTIAEAKRNRAAKDSKKAHEIAQQTNKKASAKDSEIDYKKINKHDLVFRIMTFDHVPLAPGRKKTVKSRADILQLTQIGLQFDESKSNNPFAYYTAAVTNSFVRIINIEKRNQNIRDDILEMNGMNPSWTRQNSGGGSGVAPGPVVTDSSDWD